MVGNWAVLTTVSAVQVQQQQGLAYNNYTTQHSSTSQRFSGMNRLHNRWARKNFGEMQFAWKHKTANLAVTF